MKLFIFKTDIGTKKQVRAVKPVFQDHPVIIRWSVDTDDIDNVLRIEATGDLTEDAIIHLLEPHGFHCEPLPD